MDAYQMVIANTARFIQRQSQNGGGGEDAEPEVESGQGLDLFTAAQVIAIGFCKIQGDVINDLLRAGSPRPAPFQEVGLGVINPRGLKRLRVYK